MNRLRELAVDGALLALPLGAAAYLLYKVIGLLMKLLAPVANLLPQSHWLGVGLLELAAVALLVLALIALGAVARSALGRRIAEMIENVVLSQIPGYLMVKSVAAGFSSTGRDTGLRPALVSFDDNTVLGFIVETSDADRLTVFVPDAPSATSGTVMLVSRERVQTLDVSTAGAMRAMKQCGLGLQELARASGTPQAGPPG